MENHNISLDFVAGIKPTGAAAQEDLFFIFYKGQLLVRWVKDTPYIPWREDIQSLQIKLTYENYIGDLKGISCYTGELSDEIQDSEKLKLCDLHTLMDLLEEEMFALAGRAAQILHWDKTHQFCGRCGSKVRTKETERAKSCPECGHISYPQICPAIIVAVTKGKEILLVHNTRFPEGLYSNVAGFVDAGENFEQCVAREVYEEVGLHVKNIRYYGSQPWPFPNSLMIGFTAEYDGGELQVDGEEVGDGGWFTVDELPDIPSKATIARRLIDSFIESQQ